MPFKDVPGENENDRHRRLQEWVDGDDWKFEYALKHPENIPDDYEHGDEDFDIPDSHFKLILTPKEDRLQLFGAEASLPVGLVDPPNPLPADPLTCGYANIPKNWKLENQLLSDWYAQVGGTCGGYSGAQGGTEAFTHYPDVVEVFSGLDMYKACREAGGVNPNDINGGILMPWLAKALTTKGRMRRYGGVWQPRAVQWGATSTWWGANDQDVRKVIYNSWLAYTGQPDLPRFTVQIGIPIYQAFLSPKLVGNTYWVYWQDGSWGAFKGGHAMLVADWSDVLKLLTGSRGSILLPNTWNGDFPSARMTAEAFMRCINGDGEILFTQVGQAGPPPPTGKLELVSFAPNPVAPVEGNDVALPLSVKNIGNAVWSGGLAVEEKFNGAGTAGYIGEKFDLQPGATQTYSPTRPAIEDGTWIWQGDYYQGDPPNRHYTKIANPITVVVQPGTPPPPPPPSGEPAIITIPTSIAKLPSGTEYIPNVSEVIYTKKVT